MIRKAMVTVAALAALVGGTVITQPTARADQNATSDKDKDESQLIKDRSDIKNDASKKLADIDKKMGDLRNRQVDTKKATQADVDQLKRDAESRRETIRADLARVDTATSGTIGDVKDALNKDIDALKKVVDDWSSKMMKAKSTAAKPKPKKPHK